MTTNDRHDYRTSKHTLSKARCLRADMTEAEKRLWFLLRRGQFEPVKFKRQVPIKPYIVDFACLSKRLIIQLDGGQHDSQREKDARRTAYLEARGYRVIRFGNNEVFAESGLCAGRDRRRLRRHSADAVKDRAAIRQVRSIRLRRL